MPSFWPVFGPDTPCFQEIFFGSSSELWITLFHTLAFKGYSPDRPGFSGEIDSQNSISGDDTCTSQPEPGSGHAGGRFYPYRPDFPQGRVRDDRPGFPDLRKNPQILTYSEEYPQFFERSHYPAAPPGPGRAGKMPSAGLTPRQVKRPRSGTFPRMHPGGSRAGSRTLPHGFLLQGPITGDSRFIQSMNEKPCMRRYHSAAASISR